LIQLVEEDYIKKRKKIKSKEKMDIPLVGLDEDQYNIVACDNNIRKKGRQKRVVSKDNQNLVLCNELEEFFEEIFVKYINADSMTDFIGVKVKCSSIKMIDMIENIKKYSICISRLSEHGTVMFGLKKLFDKKDIDAVQLVDYNYVGHAKTIHVEKNLYKVLSDISIYFKKSLGCIAVSCLEKTLEIYDPMYSVPHYLKVLNDDSEDVSGESDKHSLKGVNYLKTICYKEEDVIINDSRLRILNSGKADLTTCIDDKDWEVKILRSHGIIFTSSQISNMDQETNILIFEKDSDIPEDIIKFRDILDNNTKYRCRVHFTLDLNDAKDVIKFMKTYCDPQDSRNNINLSIERLLAPFKHIHSV